MVSEEVHWSNAQTNSAVQSDVANPAWGGVSSDRLGYDGAGRVITKQHVNSMAGLQVDTRHGMIHEDDFGK